MTSPLPAYYIGITIHRPFADVNEFLSIPANFEQWAAGLGKGFSQINGQWGFDTPDGRVKLRFTDRNAFGVADHYVYPPTGGEVYVPLRAVPNGDGTEVTLILFRPPEMTDQQLARDSAAMLRDLETLKAILEK